MQAEKWIDWAEAGDDYLFHGSPFFLSAHPSAGWGIAKAHKL